MGREKTGEELLSSIDEHTTIEQFELLFSQLCNHLSWFRAEQNLSEIELDRLLSSIWEAIQIKIQSSRDPIPVKRRFEDAFENMRKAGGPSTIN
jgi:hypothetical protein